MDIGTMVIVAVLTCGVLGALWGFLAMLVGARCDHDANPRAGER